MYTNLETDKAEIVLYDLKKDQAIETIFKNDSYDVSDMGISKVNGYTIDYFGYEGDKYQMLPVSKAYKKLDKAIKKQLPGTTYSVLDSTEDENLLMIYVESDKLYGVYYSYNVADNKLEELYNTMPQLKAEDMAEMRPITFTSRDGVTIHGYITLPKEALAGEKVPVIVNPHGGPQGIRDSWGFNPEAQLFASRGYAPLQVNFRISGGYGREFWSQDLSKLVVKLWMMLKTDCNM